MSKAAIQACPPGFAAPCGWQIQLETAARYVVMNTSPAKAGGYGFRLKTGSIRHTADSPSPHVARTGMPVTGQRREQLPEDRGKGTDTASRCS
jgi:hypothetical protein